MKKNLKIQMILNQKSQVKIDLTIKMKIKLSTTLLWTIHSMFVHNKVLEFERSTKVGIIIN